MFDYALDLTPDDNGTWLITSPDFAELTTFARQGDVSEAVARGRDALVAVLAHRMDSGEAIPDPSPARNRLVVRLPTLAGLKVTLYREMQAQRIAVSELARRIERDPKDVRRLLDVTHGSRTDLLDRALAAIDVQTSTAVIAIRKLVKDDDRGRRLREAAARGADIRALLRIAKRKDSQLARALRRSV